MNSPFEEVEKLILLLDEMEAIHSETAKINSDYGTPMVMVFWDDWRDAIQQAHEQQREARRVRLLADFKPKNDSAMKEIQRLCIALTPEADRLGVDWEPVRDFVCNNDAQHRIQAKKRAIELQGMLLVKKTKTDKKVTGNPNDTEQNILDALREHGQRMIGEALGQKAIGKCNSSFKATLSSMVKRGLLTSRTDTNPKGYGLPEWGN